MAHLATGPAFLFPIEMEGRLRLAGKVSPGFNLGAQDIGHFHIEVTLRLGQGPAGNGADVKLELGEEAGILSPVAGVVNPGGDLVDEQVLTALLLDEEKLNGHHPHKPKRVRQGGAKLAGGSGGLLADAGGNDG